MPTGGGYGERPAYAAPGNAYVPSVQPGDDMYIHTLTKLLCWLCLQAFSARYIAEEQARSLIMASRLTLWLTNGWHFAECKQEAGFRQGQGIHVCLL